MKINRSIIHCDYYSLDLSYIDTYTISATPQIWVWVGIDRWQIEHFIGRYNRIMKGGSPNIIFWATPIFLWCTALLLFTYCHNVHEFLDYTVYAFTCALILNILLYLYNYTYYYVEDRRLKSSSSLCVLPIYIGRPSYTSYIVWNLLVMINIVL